MAAEVRLIRTKRDYETALKEVERLGVRRPERQTAIAWMFWRR
jgi:antitoxin component HigA of HigAB toxin-antitoxin module